MWVIAHMHIRGQVVEIISIELWLIMILCQNLVFWLHNTGTLTEVLVSRNYHVHNMSRVNC